MKETLRIAAVADIHVKKTGQGSMQSLFAAASEQADVLLLCATSQITDWSRGKGPGEKITTSLRIPVIGILGNHDFRIREAGMTCEDHDRAGVTMLDGDSHEIEGVGFAA